jgi:hypothetical protein
VLWELNGSEVQTFIPNLVVFALLHIQIYWELFGIYGLLSVYTPANTL